MTLDDFFTLTEMNNGLAAPSRVRELVAVMQKESDSVVKNIGEATRQWHAVASAIAATENQECLDLFIQLDGLQFIVKWLKDAQNFGNDSNDDFVEESVTHMLRALGKLRVGYEKLVDSEMWTTIKNLLVHSSSKVQEKARVLFESWKGTKDGDASLSNVERLEALKDGEMGKSAESKSGGGQSESSHRDDFLSRGTFCKEKDQESTRDDPVLSAGSDAVHPGQAENKHNLNKRTSPAAGNDTTLDHVDVSSPVKPATRLLMSHSMGATLTKSCNSAVFRQDTLGGGVNSHEFQPASDVLKVEDSSGKLELAEEFNSSEGRSLPSCSGDADAIKSITEPFSPKKSVAGHTGLCNQDSASNESRTIDSNGKGSVENAFAASQCGSSRATDIGDELKGRKLCESSGVVRSLESTKGFGAYLSGMLDHGKISKDDELTSDVNLTNDYKFVKTIKDRAPVQAGKKSDAELLGIVDPLEMARQVAIEVVDYREQSGSVSEKQANSNVRRPDSLDSVSGRQSHASKSSSKDGSSDLELSNEASPMQEESTTSTNNLDAEQTNGIQMATSQVTEITEDDNTEKDPCNFDLNQEVYLEDAEHPWNKLNTPISIISASRAAAAAPGLPVIPLQFEGNHGWKGSAATSAFRPASPRRMPESEKDLYAGGNIGSSKLRQGCLDIDLNVAESVDGRTEYQPPEKCVPLFSTLSRLGESSVGTNPKSGQLELDLNHTSEDGAHPFMRQFFPHGNDFDNPCHSSSSKLPSLKNIDLNDQPSLLKGSSGNSFSSKLSQNFNVSGDLKSDRSVISIMGTRVEVNRRDCASQTVALSNGRTSDVAFDVNSARTGTFLGVLPFAHSSVYGYNNTAPGSVMPFPSTMYGSGGPVPYMVDFRGTPVIPQIVDSTSAMPTGFSQTPFFMNMSTPTPSNIGAVGPSRSNFDLNSGAMIEGGNRDPPGFTQFLNLGPVKSMDDHTRYNSQPSFGSVVGGKRKEPENGWEHNPVRHFTPPWK